MNAEISMKGVAKGSIIGGLAAGALCIGIYFVARAMGADFHPKDPAAMQGMEVLPPFQPMVNCLIAAVVSIGLVALLKKVAPNKAWPIYLGVAAVVFIVELFLPPAMFGDMKTIVALELMHVPATLGVVGGIYRFGIKGRSPQAVTA